MICGDPPVDRFDVKGLEATLSRLKSGDHDYVAEVLPKILSATMDESGGVPVCAGHANYIWGKISEAFEEQQAFKVWLATRKQTGT